MRTEAEIKARIYEHLALAGQKTLDIDSFKDFAEHITSITWIDGYTKALEWVLNEQKEEQ